VVLLVAHLVDPVAQRVAAGFGEQARNRRPYLTVIRLPAGGGEHAPARPAAMSG